MLRITKPFLLIIFFVFFEWQIVFGQVRFLKEHQRLYYSQIIEIARDQLFFIGSALFQAQPACYHMQAGDMVVFVNIRGSYAEFMNMRTKTLCKVQRIR